MDIVTQLLITATVAQILAGAAGILILFFSLIGWIQIILRGFKEDPKEQVARDKFAEEYFKRYKVYPPK